MRKNLKLKPEFPDAQLDLVGEEIRQAYCQFRQRLVPGYRLPQRWNSTWPAAAVICLRNRLPPVDLVAAAFDLYTPYPWPNQLYGDHVVKRARELQSDQDAGRHKQRIQQELCEFEYFLRVLCKYDLAAVLSDPVANLTPLFRQAMARMCGRPDLVGGLEPAVRRQLTYEDSAYVDLCRQMAALTPLAGEGRSA